MFQCPRDAGAAEIWEWWLAGRSEGQVLGWDWPVGGDGPTVGQVLVRACLEQEKLLGSYMEGVAQENN